MTFLTAAALLAVAPVAGADPGDHGKGPPEFTLDHPGIQRAIAAQEAVTGELMAQAAILGTAVTVTEDGEPAVLVLINADDLKMADTIASLPRHVQGVALRVQVTDKIIPMPAKVPAGKPEKPGKPDKPEPVSHTDPQSLPIPGHLRRLGP